MAQVIPLRNGYYSDFRFKGRRIRRFLSKNERDAIVELGKLIERVKGERRTDRQDLPWETFKERLFHGQAPHKKANTQKRDRSSLATLELHFSPQYLSDITPKMLDDLATIRLREGKKPATVKRELGSIKAKMRWAEKKGLCSAQDWRGVELPRVPKKRPHYHRKDQLKHLRTFCKGVWERVCRLGARAGLRRAEMFWLEKTDIHLDERFIRIQGKDGWQPKDSDERDIYLLDDLADYLRAELPRIPGRWVLGDDNGIRPGLEVMSVYFKKLTRKAGLKGGIQTLRHTYGTHLANDGVNIYALQKWMGHSNVETTMGYLNPAEEYAPEGAKIRPVF